MEPTHYRASPMPSIHVVDLDSETLSPEVDKHSQSCPPQQDDHPIASSPASVDPLCRSDSTQLPSSPILNSKSGVSPFNLHAAATTQRPVHHRSYSTITPSSHSSTHILSQQRTGSLSSPLVQNKLPSPLVQNPLGRQDDKNAAVAGTTTSVGANSSDPSTRTSPFVGYDDTVPLHLGHDAAEDGLHHASHTGTGHCHCHGQHSPGTKELPGPDLLKPARNLAPAAVARGSTPPTSLAPNGNGTTAGGSSGAGSSGALRPVAMRPGMFRFHSSPVIPSMSPTRQHFRLPNPSPRPIKETYNASAKEDATGRRTINHYIVDKEIGKGSYGSVRTAIDQLTNAKYALKEYSKQRLRKLNRSELMLLRRKALKGRGSVALSLEQENDQLNLSSKLNDLSNPLNLLRREIAIMKKLDHPNIVSLVEVLDDPHGDTLYVILEWCEKGVIMPRRRNSNPQDNDDDDADYYSEEQCRLLFRDIILGVEFLHSQRIMHRDIKAENILVNDEDVVKLVDFGVSEIFEQDNDSIKKTAGSPAYMAPELARLILNPTSSPSLAGQEIPLTISSPADQQSTAVSGRAADIWSMGVTLYYMRYGFLPFTGETVPDLYESILSHDPQLDGPSDGSNPSSELFMDLLSRILEKNPKKRISMSQMRDHPWVTCNGEDLLLSREENTSALIEPVNEEDIISAIELIEGKMDLSQATAKLRKFHGWRGDLVESAQQSRESSRSPSNHFRNHSGDYGPAQFKLTRALNEIICKNSHDDLQRGQARSPNLRGADRDENPSQDHSRDRGRDRSCGCDSDCTKDNRENSRSCDNDDKDNRDKFECGCLEDNNDNNELPQRRRSRSRKREQFVGLTALRSRSLDYFEERSDEKYRQ